MCAVLPVEGPDDNAELLQIQSEIDALFDTPVIPKARPPVRRNLGPVGSRQEYQRLYFQVVVKREPGQLEKRRANTRLWMRAYRAKRKLEGQGNGRDNNN